VAGNLAFAVLESGRAIKARRDAEVPARFWSKARAEWGSEGREPNVALEVRLEVFLANLGWLPEACRRHGVSLQWDDGAAELVARHRAEGQALRLAIADVDGEVDVAERLADTRFGARELRDFQADDLAEQLGLANAANFSVPGAGKTTVQIACYEAERKAGRVEQMLVVGPLAAYEVWEAETAACLEPAPRIHYHDGTPIPAQTEILFVNYQRLLYSYESTATWVQSAPTLVCLDEAHRIKRGRAGEWGSACLDLGYLAARRDILTGTPAPQSPRDLAVLLDYLWLGRGHEVLPPGVWASRPPDGIGPEVAAAIAPLYVRTTKKDLDLPDVEKNVVPVPLEGLQREIYEALRNRYAGTLRLDERARANFTRMGQVLMYLLEAASNPALLTAGSSDDDPPYFQHPPLAISEDASLSDLLTSYGAYETPAKYLALFQLLEENKGNDRKSLVWSNFVRNLELLHGELGIYRPAIVHGGIPSEFNQPGAELTREGELERFREDDDCWVLLANPAAVGEGISLHRHCHEAVYLERTFNAGQYLQSIDRIHRLGLDPTEVTRVSFLICSGTVDEVVDARVAEKAGRLGEMLDDPGIATMSLPDEEDVGPPFDAGDAADLAALFGHLRPDG
jgi:SNF2-related domain